MQQVPAQIRSRDEYFQAKLAVRKQKRAVRDLYKRLLTETDPLAYYNHLADTALAQARLDDCFAQVSEWEGRRMRRPAA